MMSSCASVSAMRRATLAKICDQMRSRTAALTARSRLLVGLTALRPRPGDSSVMLIAAAGRIARVSDHDLSGGVPPKAAGSSLLALRFREEPLTVVVSAPPIRIEV